MPRNQIRANWGSSSKKEKEKEEEKEGEEIRSVPRSLVRAQPVLRKM